MTEKKTGPASLAATAYAETPLAPNAQAQPTTNPHAQTYGQQPATNPNAFVPGAQSGVNPTGPVVGQETSGGGPIGRTIKGRYKIKRLLGEGGMGGVYEGEHLEIGKRVAIKLVHGIHARDPHIAARIKQEARSTGSIESENIVQVFDAGEDEDLGLFLVMELLKGEDLGALLARKGKLSPMASATLVLQAAMGLSRAHAAGIVHRDLKPANIFIVTRDDGSSLVKLVDFGIAKLIRDANQTQTPGLTRMGMVIGTPQYMSPEQAQGLPTVDHRTDIYSLGAVLFECVCGASPYPEMPTYEQTILQIMTRPPPHMVQVVPDVHPELDQLCAEMMSHDPNARPRDMAAIRDRILRIFPQIEGGRLPMRSLTNEMGYDATVSPDASGQARALVDAARLALPQSGVGTVPRPPTGSQPGLYGAAPTGSSPRMSAYGVTAAEDEPVSDVAGVPRKRSTGLVLLVAVAAAAIGIAGAVVVKMRMNANAPPQGGYGLVQSTTAAPPVTTTMAPATIPAAPPVAAATATATAAPVVPVEPAAVAAPVAKPSHGGGSRAGAKPAAPSDNKDTADRPVGGTGVSQEF